MCLGIPGKIVEVYSTGDLQMGKIDFGGAAREVCLAYVPEAEVGDYAVVHVGFAISLLSEEEANATLEMLREIVSLEDEIGPEGGAGGAPAGGLSRVVTGTGDAALPGAEATSDDVGAAGGDGAAAGDSTAAEQA